MFVSTGLCYTCIAIPRFIFIVDFNFLAEKGLLAFLGGSEMQCFIANYNYYSFIT